LIHCTLPVLTGARRKTKMTTYQETNVVAGTTQEDMKVRYTAKTHTSGGRRGGVSRSDDGRLDVKFSAPGVPGTGTNPEQLFAAGWSACFISAMGLVANRMKVKLPADAAVDAEIDLCNSGDVYFLRARLNVSLPGLGARSRPGHCGRHPPRDMRMFQRYTGQHRRYAQRRVSEA
jgi:lipoyl-dependent peroxiredoxin